jgi:predicted glutamine amidotransferase
MAGDLAFKHKKVMKDLLFFNTLRGRDSTGVSRYDKNKQEVLTHKATVPGFEFIDLPFIDDLLKPCVGAWIGHGRWKTVGQINRMNAHPFEVREDDGTISFIGAHNGTLTNKWEIERELGRGAFGTDSEAFLNLIAERGAKKALAEAKGAWALSYWNSDDDSINLLRNKERPLTYAMTDDGEVIMWASEAWMLRIACDRNEVKLTENQAKAPAIYWVPEDTLLSWPIPSFQKDEKKFAPPVRKGGLLGKPEEKRFFLPQPYLNQKSEDDRYKHVWYNRYDDDLESRLEQETIKEAAEADKKSGEKKATKDVVVGYEGELVDRQIVEELKKAGCDWCGDEIHNNAFAWLDQASLVCSRCLRGDHIVVNPAEGTIVQRVLKIVGGN